VVVAVDSVIDPRLKKEAAAMIMASRDYDDNAGDSEIAPEMWRRFCEKRETYNTKLKYITSEVTNET
jgi:hypothetical protein